MRNNELELLSFSGKKSEISGQYEKGNAEGRIIDGKPKLALRKELTVFAYEKFFLTEIFGQIIFFIFLIA